MPGFTVEKYERLKESRLSILSFNCFGGIVSHTLDLPFFSPCINMFFAPYEAFLDFCEKPREYFSEPLQFLRMDYNAADKLSYPVYKIRNVEIAMNHYADCDVAEQKWYERMARINWGNILWVIQYESLVLWRIVL